MITTQTEGRRIYIGGDTYPVRNELRDAGAKWDAGRRQWWIGSTKGDIVAQVIASVAQDAAARRDSGEAARKAKAVFDRHAKLAARRQAERVQPERAQPQRAADPGALLSDGRQFIAEKEAGFDLDSAAKLGEIFGGKGGRQFMVVAVEQVYYHSRTECEDNDCFCGRYGRRYPVAAREVTLTDAERATAAAKQAAETIEKLSMSSGESVATAPRSGKLDELKVSGERVCVRQRLVGYSCHKSWRVAEGLLTYTPVYDDSPLWSLVRYESMTPEQRAAVDAAPEVK